MRHFLTALALLPGTALAQCPTASDISKTSGVRFELARGDYELFTRFTDRVLVSVYGTGDTPTGRSLLESGFYLVETMDIIDGALDRGSRITYAYPSTADVLPLPEPGGSASYEVIGLDQDGGFSETHSYSFGAETRVTYGACSYRVIPVEMRIAEDPSFVETVHFLPELGLSYVAQFKDSEGLERYYYTGISVVK